MHSFRQIQDRFNKDYHYPFVILNEEPFTEEFMSTTTNFLAPSKVQFGTSGKSALLRPEVLLTSPPPPPLPPAGLIDKQSEWSLPNWIDDARAAQVREEMHKARVIYGDSLPYRHMCRYNSGFFFRHPLMMQYEYYWRIEPDTDLYCDIEYDPFVFMKSRGMKYGWTTSLYEYVETIPTIWNAVKDFMREHPEHLPSNNAIDFVSDNYGETYNRCHFWSNFEIGSLDFYRSKAYIDFFDTLDKAGGFYYERWGDAPVHSIGAAILLKKEELHFFYDIGYRRKSWPAPAKVSLTPLPDNPFPHCPAAGVQAGKCHCNPGDTFDHNGYSCSNRYDRIFGASRWRDEQGSLWGNQASLRNPQSG